MKNLFSLLLLLIVVSSPLRAQLLSKDDLKFNLKLDTRFDAQYTTVNDGGETPDKSGFAGKYLNLILDGQITPKFSYNFRYRLNRDPQEGDGFMHSVDWMYATWHINNKFSLSVGKQVIYIGGYEYDKAPIDVYYYSDFWKNVTCYQNGITAGYTSPNKKHTVMLQITNSPAAKTSNDNMYAYNLIWYGHSKYLNTIWSANLIEYAKDRYIKYLAFGNQLTLGRLTADADLMFRSASCNKDFTDDYSLIGNVNYKVNNKLNLFVKAGHDQNRSFETDKDGAYPDAVVKPGTEYNFYGCGVEYFPLSSPNLRLHAYWNSNDQKPTTNYFNIGIRWQINLVSAK